MEQLSKSVDMLSKTLVDENRDELSLEQTKEAKKHLVNLLFKQSVKGISDPHLLGQEYGLFSFVPARNAKPNENGVFGVFKLRGNFQTVEEAEQYSEMLIRKHDSYNVIHTVKVGNAIPLTINEGLVEEVKTVDLNQEVQKIVSEDIKQKRHQEKIAIKSIQEREQQLLKENKEIMDDEYKQDPMDSYIMLRVKKAQLMWTLSETRKRIVNEIIPALKKTKEEIRIQNEEFPEFDSLYYTRYKTARESVGIKDQDKLGYSNFMEFLLDDNDIEINDLQLFFN